MAKRRRRRAKKLEGAAEKIHPNEAAVLFQRLRDLGRIGDAHIADARRSVARDVEEITARLSQLKEMAQGPAASRRPPQIAEPRPVWRGAKTKRRAKAPVTAKRRRIQQLQGRYMALGHQIPKAEMLKFKAMIATKGKEQTVAAMDSFVKSHAKKAKKK